MLMYESYYHIGAALQHLGRHKDAIQAYTNAAMSMNLRKVGGQKWMKKFNECSSRFAEATWQHARLVVKFDQ